MRKQRGDLSRASLVARRNIALSTREQSVRVKTAAAHDGTVAHIRTIGTSLPRLICPRASGGFSALLHFYSQSTLGAGNLTGSGTYCTPERHVLYPGLSGRARLVPAAWADKPIPPTERTVVILCLLCSRGPVYHASMNHERTSRGSLV